MKKLLCLMLVLAFASIAGAANYIWDAGGGTRDWSTGTNWSPDGVPASTDSAYVNSGWDWATGDLGTGPIVDTENVVLTSFISGSANSMSGLLRMDGGSLKVTGTSYAAFDLGWTARAKGALTMNDGHIIVVGGVILAKVSDYRCNGIINMNGGILDFATGSANSLWMGMTGATTGTATINMGLHGLIRGDNLQMYSGVSHITFNPASYSYQARIELNYDASAPPNLETWLAYKTRILDYAGLMDNETFIVNEGKQRITIIPEPATVALLGLGGLALIRKRR